jgi:hypothetical protein
MVLPGIQALFGFQLIAVFSDGFVKKLSPLEQQIHYLSIILTVIAVALVMTPAAIHRQVDPFAGSRRFVRCSTVLLLLSMFPLALSICLEIYLIAHMIPGLAGSSFVSAAALLCLFASLWIVLPFIEKKSDRAATSRRP